MVLNLEVKAARNNEAEVTFNPKVMRCGDLVSDEISMERMGAVIIEMVDLSVEHKTKTEDNTWER